MQLDYLYTNNIQNSTERKLILFFTGWGMDKNPFRHLSGNEYDVIIVYDYSRFGFGECVTLFINLFHNYTHISIIAYSMGVWGASMAFEKYISSIQKTCDPSKVKKLLKKLNLCVALNGTLFPISGTWGIPQEVFTKTIENLPQGLDKFTLRMCGTKICYNQYKACAPKRDAIDVKQELIIIEENITISNSLKWDHAIISDTDYIFPSANQHTFWEDYKECSNHKLKITSIQGGHYPFFAWNTWEELLHL